MKIEYTLWIMIILFTLLSIMRGSNPLIIGCFLTILLIIKLLTWWLRNSETREIGENSI